MVGIEPPTIPYVIAMKNAPLIDCEAIYFTTAVGIEPPTIHRFLRNLFHRRLSPYKDKNKEQSTSKLAIALSFCLCTAQCRYVSC